MVRWGSKGRQNRCCSLRWVPLAAALLSALLLAWPAGAAGPISATPVSATPASAADQRCLGCHNHRGLTKQTGSGERIGMRVPADLFAASAHASLGCAACHGDIDRRSHPKQRRAIASPRAFALASAEVCQKCHDDSQREWGNGIHAALVSAGDPKGALCGDCHRVHSDAVGATLSLGGAPCKSCHQEVFAAYAGSVHGLARGKEDPQAPLCADCHGAHDVSVASSPSGPRNACLGCHEDAVRTHATWLPNTGLHFDTVSCPVCHAPAAPRRVDLQLVDAAGALRPGGKAGVPSFDSPDSSINAVAVYNLMRMLGQQPVPERVALRGRLEVSAGDALHALVPKQQALRDCAACHSAGAAAFRSVALSVAGPAGLPVHQVVDQQVLRSVLSLGAVGGFYAVGGTRIGLLDGLLLFAGTLGIGLPAAHLLAGMLIRRRHRRG